MIHEPPKGCKAVCRLDEWHCVKCKLSWDKTDPEAPEACQDREMDTHKELTKLAERYSDCDVCGSNWCGIGDDRGAPCHTTRSE